MSLTKVPNSMLVSPGGGDTPAYEQTLVNNQSTPANLTDAVVSSSTERMFEMNLYLSRIFNSTASTVDTAFCANASDNAKFTSSVDRVIEQPDGKILVHGSFTNYDGVSGRNYLIRLNADGTTDEVFCNNASDGGKFNQYSTSLSALFLQSDGKILIGGHFADYNGTVGRSRLIRLNSDGTTDTAFCIAAVDGNKFNSTVQAFGQQSDGKILIGGNFTNYGISGRSRLVRLLNDGSVDGGFCAVAVDGNKISTEVNVIKIRPNDQILFGGSFINYASFGTRNRLVQLNSDGTVDSTFCNNASDGSKFGNPVDGILIQPDGKILVNGNFVNYGGVSTRNRCVRLNVDGTVDAAFCVNAIDGNKLQANGNVLALQTDGKIIIRSWSSYGGAPNTIAVVRINSDGTLDTTFATEVVQGSGFGANDIHGALQLSTGALLLCGTFADYKLALRNRLISILPGLTTDLQALGTINGFYSPTTTSWYLGNTYEISQNLGVNFNITPVGQIQYTTTNLPGTEVENLIKYKINKI